VIRDNGGWQNWIMEIVNFFNCNDHYEARKKEQEYFILLNATLNSIEPMPKPKEKKVVIKCNPNQPLTYDVSNTIFGNEKLNEEHIKITNKFVCEKCAFICCKQSDWARHTLTSKHKKHDYGNNGNAVYAKFVCQHCNKLYSSASGLWKHKKTCNNSITNKLDMNELLDDDNKIISFILDVVKSNSELQKQNQEFQQQMMETFQEVCKNNNTNITNNGTIN
jgi:hypothetical protein